MAKIENQAPVVAPDDIEVELFVPEREPSPYDAHIEKMIAADEERTEEQVKKGAHNSVAVLFPTTEKRTRKGEEVEIDAVAKYQRFFQNAARDHGRSAKILGKPEDQGNGYTKVRFYLVDKIDKPRGGKPVESDESDVPESIDA